MNKHNNIFYYQGFKYRDQMVAMLFLQLSKACSLTEVCQGLRTCVGKPIHLGLAKAPGKSTLAYANEKREGCVVEAKSLNLQGFICMAGRPVGHATDNA